MLHIDIKYCILRWKNVGMQCSFALLRSNISKSRHLTIYMLSKVCSDHHNHYQFLNLKIVRGMGKRGLKGHTLSSVLLCLSWVYMERRSEKVFPVSPWGCHTTSCIAAHIFVLLPWCLVRFFRNNFMSINALEPSQLSSFAGWQKGIKL